jgi:hypothetical protein
VHFCGFTQTVYSRCQRAQRVSVCHAQKQIRPAVLCAYLSADLGERPSLAARC